MTTGYQKGKKSDTGNQDKILNHLIIIEPGTKKRILKKHVVPAIFALWFFRILPWIACAFFTPIKGLISFACACCTDVLSGMQEYADFVWRPVEMP